MNMLPHQIVIENVLQCKMRGRVAYQSHFPASIGLQLTYVKPFDLPSGKGYQRPVDPKMCEDFSTYLSNGSDALFTPILLNAASNWEFVAYDQQRPSYGRLMCRGKASLMDGQHRMGGIQKYTEKTNSDLNIPFLAFHSLDEDEEVKLFDTINTKAKGIGPSLSKFLRRDADELSWIATELLVQKESPFYNIGTIIGKRNKDRNITLQNLYRTVHLLTADYRISSLSKQEKLTVALTFYDAIRQKFGIEWASYKEYRLTHIVCLDALSLAGQKVLLKCIPEGKKQINLLSIPQYIDKLKVDWSAQGALKYLKGMSGSRTLAADLIEKMLPN